MAIRTATRIGGGQQLCRHGGAGSALDGGRRQGQVLGHRPAPVRAVAVQVLQAHEECTAALGCCHHAPLKRREALGPLRVRGVQALVDDRCTLGGVGRGVGICDVGGPPIDTVGQRGRPMSRHRPDCDTNPREPINERPTDLASPEHDVQFWLTHERLGASALAASR